MPKVGIGLGSYHNRGQKSCEIFYFKKILNTYGFGSPRPEAEKTLYGFGPSTTEVEKRLYGLG